MRILIVKTHAIGDLLLVTPSISAVRSIYPSASISVLTGKWSAPVLYNNPNIDEIITIDDSILFGRKWGKIMDFINELRKKKFDLAFIFQPSMKIRFLIYSTSIKKRIGLAFKGNNLFLTDPVLWEPNKSRYIVENYLDLVKKVKDDHFDVKVDLYLTNDEKEAANSFLDKKGIIKKEKLIGIAPGGGKNPRDHVPMKVWDKNKYVDVIKKIIEKFDHTILLFGSAMDKDICNYIKEKTSDRVIDTSGEIDLRMLMALIDKCELLLTNDSAPVHFAIAQGIPSITIFGPTNPYSLLPDHPDHTAIVSPIECSPCYSHEAFPGCDTPCCMDYIDAGCVFDAIERKLLS